MIRKKVDYKKEELEDDSGLKSKGLLLRFSQDNPSMKFDEKKVN